MTGNEGEPFLDEGTILSLIILLIAVGAFVLHRLRPDMIR